MPFQDGLALQLGQVPNSDSRVSAPREDDIISVSKANLVDDIGMAHKTGNLEKFRREPNSNGVIEAARDNMPTL